jgi:hypothetical protein
MLTYRIEEGLPYFIENAVRDSFSLLSAADCALAWKDLRSSAIVFNNKMHFDIIVVENGLPLLNTAIHPLAIIPSGSAFNLSLHILNGYETSTVNIPFQLEEDLNGFITRLCLFIEQEGIKSDWIEVMNSRGIIENLREDDMHIVPRGCHPLFIYQGGRVAPWARRCSPYGGPGRGGTAASLV